MLLNIAPTRPLAGGEGRPLRPAPQGANLAPWDLALCRARRKPLPEQDFGALPTGGHLAPCDLAL